MPKALNSSGFSSAVLLIALTLLIAAVSIPLVLGYTNKKSGKPDATPTTTKEDQVLPTPEQGISRIKSQTIEGWATYGSNKYGVEVTIPQNWFLFDNDHEKYYWLPALVGSGIEPGNKDRVVEGENRIEIQMDIQLPDPRVSEYMNAESFNESSLNVDQELIVSFCSYKDKTCTITREKEPYLISDFDVVRKMHKSIDGRIYNIEYIIGRFDPNSKEPEAIEVPKYIIAFHANPTDKHFTSKHLEIIRAIVDNFRIKTR